MTGLLIGYARCSTDGQDLTAQRNALVLSETPSGYFDFPNPQQGAYSVTAQDDLQPLSGTNDLGVETVSDLRNAAETAEMEIV